MECFPLWPTDICEKGRTLSKTYGIKARCDWEHPWGTHWEPIGTPKKRKNLPLSLPPPSPPKFKRKPVGNTLGTYWNKGKMKKIFLFPPPFPPKTFLKKTRHLECRLSLPTSCMKLLFPKLFGTVFNLE